MVAPINSCSSPFTYDSSPFLFPFFLRIAYLYSKGRLRSADPYSGGAKARGVDSVGAGCPPSFGALWCVARFGPFATQLLVAGRGGHCGDCG